MKREEISREREREKRERERRAVWLLVSFEEFFVSEPERISGFSNLNRFENTTVS